MATMKLINASGCELGVIEASTSVEVFEKALATWGDTMMDGDKIVFAQPERDADLDDFNWVGSRHHY